MNNQPQTGPEKLKEGGGKKDSPLSLVADLFRLSVIKDKLIGEEPLSRGSRESHFAEAWCYTVGHHEDPDREDAIRMDRMMAFYNRMRILSPHEKGKQIEVVERVLSPTPPTQVILGSPYDTPPEGPFAFLTNMIHGKKKED